MFSKKLRAAGVALIGFKNGVRFNRHKGRAIFNRVPHWIVKVASLFYDVRRTPSGGIYFQLKDRKAERKLQKQFIKYIRSRSAIPRESVR